MRPWPSGWRWSRRVFSLGAEPEQAEIRLLAESGSAWFSDVEVEELAEPRVSLQQRFLTALSKPEGNLNSGRILLSHIETGR